MTKHCPKCGSTDVEEQLIGWYKANGDEKLTSDLDTPTIYGDNFWCNNCQKHVNFLHEHEEPDAGRESEAPE